MNNDKVYLMFGLRTNVNFTAGVGHTYSVNLKRFLGFLWEKYNAFNIKLETTPYQFPLNNTEPFCIHMKGLNWINGFDSISPNYCDSRVLEIVQMGSRTSEDYTTSYLSNTNAIGFYRPSQFNVNLTLFFTSMNGVFFDNPDIANYRYPIIFSITGIDAYKVQNPSRGLRYSYQNNLSSVLSLRFYDGESIDPNDSIATKGRIRLFKNINLRRIIGDELFNKYKKFALISRRTYAPVGTIGYSAGIYLLQYMLSANNILFEHPCYNSDTIQNIITPQEYSNPVLIGFSELYKDTYIEYVFSKPLSDLTDITISVQYCLGTANGLASPDNSNNILFPDIRFLFEIIPVVDDY